MDNKYCKKCGYLLNTLPTGQCPECGHAFWASNRGTYDSRSYTWRLRKYFKYGGVIFIFMVLVCLPIVQPVLSEWRKIKDLESHARFVEISRSGKPSLLLGDFVDETYDVYQGPARKIRANFTGKNSDVLNKSLSFTALQELSIDYRGDTIPRIKSGSLVLAQQLKKLHLNRAVLTSENLQSISKITTIREISFENCHISGNGLASLSEIPHLKILSLLNSDIKDRDLEWLRGNQTITTLDLRGTGVTNHSLEIASHIKNLQSLDVFQTNITSRGVLEFISKNPSVKVDGVWATMSVAHMNRKVNKGELFNYYRDHPFVYKPVRTPYLLKSSVSEILLFDEDTSNLQSLEFATDVEKGEIFYRSMLK